MLHDQWDDAALELGHEGIFLCGFKGREGGWGSRGEGQRGRFATEVKHAGQVSP